MNVICPGLLVPLVSFPSGTRHHRVLGRNPRFMSQASKHCHRGSSKSAAEKSSVATSTRCNWRLAAVGNSVVGAAAGYRVSVRNGPAPHLAEPRKSRTLFLGVRRRLPRRDDLEYLAKRAPVVTSKRHSQRKAAQMRRAAACLVAAAIVYAVGVGVFLLAN
jgi:hypothetical protein